MFEKVNIPLLGVVENMSFFKNTENGSKSYPFGKGGGKITAKALDTTLLAEIGLDEEIREGGDHGLPIVISDPENENSQLFLHLAEQLVKECLTLDLAVKGMLSHKAIVLPLFYRISL